MHTTWTKKKRESKPQKPCMGDPENMDQEKEEKEEESKTLNKWEPSSHWWTQNEPKEKKKKTLETIWKRRENPNTWPCI